MDLTEFKAEVRLCRGKLTRHDDDLKIIYEQAVPELHEFVLKQKQMGVANVAYIASEYSQDEQREFCAWMAEKGFKATKNELELKLGEF